MNKFKFPIREINIKRIIIFAVISSGFVCSAFADNGAEFTANSKTKAVFLLDSSSRKTETFSAHINIYNNNPFPRKNWELGFTFVRPITSINGAIIVKHIGDYYLITGTNKDKTIPAYGKVTFNFQGQYCVEHETDTPSGYFMTTVWNGIESKPVAIAGQSVLLPWKPSSGEDDYTQNIKKYNTSIEGNPVENNLPMDNSLIVPLPVQLTRNQGNFVLTKDIKILVEKGNAGAFKTAEFLVNAISPATGFHNVIAPTASSQPIAKTILFTTKGIDRDNLGEEGYVLDVTPESIVIRANTSAGLFYGVESLRQLLPPQIFETEKQHNIIWQVPAVDITDYPRFAYRGLMLDTARHFQSAAAIKRLLDLMALNKLNNFHWHLTDDEAWRIQINYYPQLTNIGAWRGYKMPLTPSLGSSIGPYGGFYTRSQIRNIVKYAAERHITIIPEIDMPGHARAMIKSLPRQLIDPQDHSEYTSVQGYHDDVLSPCIPSTYRIIDHVMTEVAQLFPGKYIHVGSDEVPNGVWQKSPSCIALMQKEGLKDKEQLQHYFLKQVQNIVKSKGKLMAGWEEVVAGGNLDKNTRVYSWQGVEAGINAAKQGYQVIMAPAQHLYFDLAYSADSKEPGYYWAGYVDTFAAYNYSPITKEMEDLNIAKNIEGVQGELWSENINSPDRLDYLAFPKVAALAELAWTPKNRRNWRNFSERLGKFYLPRLDNYGVHYRISLPGVNFTNHLLKANIEFPGLVMHYTLDGSNPNQDSEVYTQPFSTMANVIKMRSFSSKGRGGRIVDVN